MGDHHLVNWAVEELKKVRDRPLFLAVGFVKPHLPFYAPKKYFDQFPLDGIVLPQSPDNDLDDIPDSGLRMAKPQGEHASVLGQGEEEWKRAVQAYLATIAFVDHEVGRLMKGLDESGKAENTIVVFWGDHGWHLGEKKHWRKFALWNDTTRVPFFMIAPGVTRAGAACRAPVDLLSIYPTLCELTGVGRPSHSLEGQDLRPLLEDPGANWEWPAISTHGKGNHMIQTRHHRYIRYVNDEEELYDHRSDPNEFENLAGREESEETIEKLASWIPASEVAPVAKVPSKKKKKKN